MTVRLRLDIAYDGTHFSGWAAQPGRRTVAGTLTGALEILFRQDVPMVVAGRTDAGVHASGQVAHIDVPGNGLHALAPRVRGTAGINAPATPDAGPRTADTERLEPTGAEAGPSPDAFPAGPSPGAFAVEPPPGGFTAGRLGLLRRLAGLLPPDVRVRRVGVAPPGFDARFSALRRHYRYRIGAAEWGVDPLRRLDVFARRRPLDVEAMTQAIHPLIGLHDFAAFCKPRDGATTVRELQVLTVMQQDEMVVIDVQADAFCHSMVRSLVGALIAVGDHQAPVGRPAQLLAAANRSSGVHVAPAMGLTLVAVDYPPDDELADRAAATRVVRQLPTG